MKEEFDIERWREYLVRPRQAVVEGLRRVRYIAGRTILIAVLVYIGFGAYLFFAQRGMLYQPTATDPGSCARFEAGGVKKFSHNGTTLYHKENGSTLVVFYHGNGGTACDRKFLADFLDARDISYLFVEYAGYGDWQHSTKEALLENVRDADTFISTLEYEMLVIMGESLGTGLATEHMKLHEANVLILISPYTSIRDLAQENFPWYPSRFLVRDNYENDLSSKRFNGRLLVIHGKADEVIPFTQGEKVFDSALFPVKEFLSLEEAHHNDIYYDDKVFRVISRYLAQASILEQ